MNFFKKAGRSLWSFGKDVVGGFKLGLRYAHALPLVGGLLDEAGAVGKALLGSYVSGKIGKFLN